MVCETVDELERCSMLYLVVCNEVAGNTDTALFTAGGRDCSGRGGVPEGQGTAGRDLGSAHTPVPASRGSAGDAVLEPSCSLLSGI